METTSNQLLEEELEGYEKGLQFAPEDLWARRKVALLKRRLRRMDDYLQELVRMAEHASAQGNFLTLIEALCQLMHADPNFPIPNALLEAVVQQHESPAPLSNPSSMIGYVPWLWSRAPTFSQLDGPDVRKMLKRFRLMQLQGDTLLMREKEALSAVYLVMEGSFALGRKDIDGIDCLLETAEEGACIGIMELFSGSKVLMNCAALEDSVILELPTAALLELSRRNGQLRQQLEQLYTEQIYNTLQRTLPKLRQLNEIDRQALLKRAKLSVLEPGELAYIPGRDDDWLHILLRGAVVGNSSQPASFLQEPALFGHCQDILAQNVFVPLAATVSTIVLSIPRHTIQNILRPQHDLFKEIEQRMSSVAQPAAPTHFSTHQAKHLQHGPQLGALAMLQQLCRQEQTGIFLASIGAHETIILLHQGKLVWASQHGEKTPFWDLLRQRGISPESISKQLEQAIRSQQPLSASLFEEQKLSVQEFETDWAAHVRTCLAPLVASPEQGASLFLPRQATPTAPLVALDPKEHALFP